MDIWWPMDTMEMWWSMESPIHSKLLTSSCAGVFSVHSSIRSRSLLSRNYMWYFFFFNISISQYLSLGHKMESKICEVVPGQLNNSRELVEKRCKLGAENQIQ